ncbi:hypothetical protein DNTS_033081, partial [Danionella cerebrum]
MEWNETLSQSPNTIEDKLLVDEGERSCLWFCFPSQSEVFHSPWKCFQSDGERGRVTMVSHLSEKESFTCTADMDGAQAPAEDPGHRSGQARAGTVVLLIGSIFFFTHLDESPLTGRTRLLVFSRENFRELAQITANGYMEEFKDSMVSPSDPRHQVVEKVVQILTQRNQDIAEISSVSWVVHVVDSPTMNAFILPNGEIFVFTGMLDAVKDIHQLSFILGHEMAHALIGHSAEQASLSHVVELLSLVLLTAIWAICPRDSLALLGHWVQNKLVQFLFDRPFSRKLEAEADQVGLQLAAKACADVRAGPVFWEQMELYDHLRGEPSIPEWLSTHPSHQNRVKQLDRLIP